MSLSSTTLTVADQLFQPMGDDSTWGAQWARQAAWGHLDEPLHQQDQQQHQRQHQQQYQQQHQGMMPSASPTTSHARSLMPAQMAPASPPTSQLHFVQQQEEDENEEGRYGSSKANDEGSKSAFASYESRYGPAVRCTEGPCEQEPAAPCKEHRCSCCKLLRQAASGTSSSSRQGLCGPCGRREVVGGLSFVRCGRCRAEMLESTYAAHLKQNVVVTDPVTGVKVAGRCRDYAMELVFTDKGRRCSKCANMRPVTYYANDDSTRTCNLHVTTKQPGSSSPAHAAAATSTGQHHLSNMAVALRPASQPPSPSALLPGLLFSGPANNAAGHNAATTAATGMTAAAEAQRQTLMQVCKQMTDAAERLEGDAASRSGLAGLTAALAAEAQRSSSSHGVQTEVSAEMASAAQRLPQAARRAQEVAAQLISASRCFPVAATAAAFSPSPTLNPNPTNSTDILAMLMGPLPPLEAPQQQQQQQQPVQPPPPTPNSGSHSPSAFAFDTRTSATSAGMPASSAPGGSANAIATATAWPARLSTAGTATTTNTNTNTPDLPSPFRSAAASNPSANPSTTQAADLAQACKQAVELSAAFESRTYMLRAALADALAKRLPLTAAATAQMEAAAQKTMRLARRAEEAAGKLAAAAGCIGGGSAGGLGAPASSAPSLPVVAVPPSTVMMHAPPSQPQAVGGAVGAAWAAPAQQRKPQQAEAVGLGIGGVGVSPRSSCTTGYQAAMSTGGPQQQHQQQQHYQQQQVSVVHVQPLQHVHQLQEMPARRPSVSAFALGDLAGLQQQQQQAQRRATSSSACTRAYASTTAGGQQQQHQVQQGHLGHWQEQPFDFLSCGPAPMVPIRVLMGEGLPQQAPMAPVLQQPFQQFQQQQEGHGLLQRGAMSVSGARVKRRSEEQLVVMSTADMEGLEDQEEEEVVTLARPSKQQRQQQQQQVVAVPSAGFFQY